ncbi:MAG: hypothetical protein KIS74_17115 [Burkholderiales bacterium]|nr:hypothetical protein [Burkholderiales bacterium]
MRNRLLRRCVAALVAFATLVAPLAWPLHALAGPGGRTLPVTVCSSQGAGVRSAIVLPGTPPSDRGLSHACQACVLCSAGGDRPDPGPVPASIVVPACSATAEAPVARPGSGPAPGTARLPRARDPPSLA